ncbi:MAG: radical SAM protein [Nanoarchaeota archaeon]|nr:radical SAM protein [Nanoarchaeota archaeon]MCA9495895.1 radical SAM protein [Nanoarchaeota archaeon]
MNFIKDSTCLFSYGEKLRVVWEITHKCNYACNHCCVDAVKSQIKELSKEKVFMGIDNLVDFGLEAIYFSGGEPLLKEDFYDILEYTGNKISPNNITIATNGKFITEEVAKKLSDLNIGSVLVSLDGHDPKTAQDFRNFSGTYDFAINAIKLLTEKNIKVRVGVVIWKGNENYLEEFVKVGLKYGVDNIFFGWLVPVGTKEVHSLGVEKERFFEIASELKDLKEKYQNEIKVTYHRFEEINDNCNNCQAGKKILHLLPNGEVTPCSWLYKVSKNFCSEKKIYELPLKEILQESSFEKLQDMLNRRKKNNLGPGCPAMCKAFGNDFQIYDPLYKGIYGKGIFHK